MPDIGGGRATSPAPELVSVACCCGQGYHRSECKAPATANPAPLTVAQAHKQARWADGHELWARRRLSLPHQRPRPNGRRPWQVDLARTMHHFGWPPHPIQPGSTAWHVYASVRSNRRARARSMITCMHGRTSCMCSRGWLFGEYAVLPPHLDLCCMHVWALAA